MFALTPVFAGLLATAPAGAWSLEEQSSWATPGEARSLAMADHGLMLLGEEALWLVDPSTGAVADQLEPGGRSLLLEDRNGNGTLDAVFCRDEGLVWVPASLNLSTAGSITSEGCDALVAGTWDGVDGYATAGDTVQLWSGNGAAIDEPDMQIDGAALLATRTDGLLAAAVGDDQVQELDTLGTNLLAAGGLVASLGVIDDRWAWTISDAWLLATEDGTLTPLAAEPGAFLVAEFDGDDAPDTLVLHPADASVTLVRGVDGSAHNVPLGFGPGAAILHSVDGDLCWDLIMLDADGSTVRTMLTTGCGEHLDGDGDGVSTEAGDCDDDNAAVYPGAVETCDGVDNDCDGEVDEYNVTLVSELTVPDTGHFGAFDPRWDGDSGRDTGDAPEGGVFRVAVTVEGCFDELDSELFHSYEGPISCESEGQDDGPPFRCRLLDQGRSSMDFWLLNSDDGSLVDAVNFDFAARNVAPWLLGLEVVAYDDGEGGGGGGWGCGGGTTNIRTSPMEVELNASVRGVLRAHEPGEDDYELVAFCDEAEVEIDHDEVLFTNPSGEQGVWAIEVTMVDEDGGRRVELFEIVASGDPGDDWDSWDDDDDDDWDSWEDDDYDPWDWEPIDCGPDPADHVCGCILLPETSDCGCHAGASGVGLFGLVWVVFRRRREDPSPVQSSSESAQPVPEP